LAGEIRGERTRGGLELGAQVGRERISASRDDLMQGRGGGLLALGDSKLVRVDPFGAPTCKIHFDRAPLPAPTGSAAFAVLSH